VTALGAPHSGVPRWSPDGRQIAFASNIEGQGDIYVVNTSGGKPRRLTLEPASDVRPSWSRDGRWIYFGSNRSGEDQVWKMPAGGGEALKLSQKGGCFALESPDSQWVYYVKNHWDSPLWKVPRDGGEETQVLESVYRVDFAIVKEGIYFIPKPDSAGRYSIQFFNSTTKRIRSVSTVDGPIGNDLSVSPDGRWILYSQTDHSGTDLMLVEHFR
jgi:Tol biopolymer transport system component